MAFIFGPRKKGPSELVKSTKKHIDLLEEHNRNSDEKMLKKVRRGRRGKRQERTAQSTALDHFLVLIPTRL
jgi:hypothetical protein